MVDFKYGAYSYDFTNMILYLGKRVRHPIKLSVVNGTLGWTDMSGTWWPELPQAIDAYEAWLDKQIYGESNG